MLTCARWLMILAGILGLPSVACSGFFARDGRLAEFDPFSQAIYGFLFWAALLSCFGCIVVGAKARMIGKTLSGILALLFATVYVSLVLQADVFGLPAAYLLLAAAAVIFAAPPEDFRRPVTQP